MTEPGGVAGGRRPSTAVPRAQAGNGRVASALPTFARSARRGEARTAYAMAGPALLVVGLFTLYPIAYALRGSLYTLSPILPSSYVGLTNYGLVFGSPYFGFALERTALFALATVPTVLVIGVLAAALLTQRFRGDLLVKIALLFPWAIPATASGVLWKGIFADSWGALNAVSFKLGLIHDYAPWLTTPHLAFTAVAIAQIWAQFPLATVLLLAAMQAIPHDLYEAAALDGAGGLRMFGSITLPHIQPMALIVALFETLLALTTFDLLFALTGGGPGTATTVLSYFIWSETFKMLSFGKGMALAVIIAAMALVLIAALMRLMPADALLGAES
ncbi:MAG TPA: sugar ABC transporter permease [bacterium]|nr:sugar ABC transporter permease [bacterium]